MADLSLPSSLLRINDIKFKVPPRNITIIKQDHNLSAPTLRSQISTSVKSGQRTITIIVDMYFASGYNALRKEEENAETWINEQLAPLLIQTRKCPFVSIENEKIRKEIFGNPEAGGIEASKDVNIAGVIKQIDVESKAREPGVFYARIHMELFNYSPYSRDFKYKHRENNGNVIARDTPGNQFDYFVDSGTFIKDGKEGLPSRYINAIIPGEDDLEIIYKEYQKVGLEKLKYKEELEALTSIGFDKEEEIIVPLRSRTSAYEGKLESLRREGWQLDIDFAATEREPGEIAFRYRKFIIKNTSPDKLLSSGKLILESGGLSLQTKTPSIPLLGHTIPTSQFLGVSDGNLSFSLFANAELENQEDNGEAVGTSNELSTLNSIIELVNRNAVEYRRVAKNDSIFIRHPLARLLKYKPYDEQKLSVYNTKDNIVESFNPEDYLACIINKTESETVQGHPYCSRFNFSLSENYRSNFGVERINKGSSNRVYDSSKKLILELSKKFKIEKDLSTGKFKINPEAPSGDPDFKIAEKLRNSLNDALILKDFNTAEEAITDPFFVDSRLKDLKRKATELARTGDPRAEKAREALAKELASGRVPFTADIRPLSTDVLSSLIFDLIKITGQAENKDERFSQYQEHLLEFTRYNSVTEESTYPDMMLPDKTIQPDFFFYNISDEGNNRHKKKVQRRVTEKHEEVARQYAENAANKNANQKFSKDFMSSSGPVSAAPNVVALGSEEDRPEESETDKAFTQLPLDLDQRDINLSRTINDFSENTYTMRRSMPTFKLYIREGDIGSFGDIDKDRLRKASSGGAWRNFSDMYDLNGIIDIRLVKDKDNPADLLVIRMTNTREDIVNKSFEDQSNKLERKISNSQRKRPKNSEDIVDDSDDIMLREGIRIELRLGHEGDPNHLSIEFSGRISQIGGGDIVEILCQGDGVELIQELKGVVPGEGEKYTWNSDTSNIISEILHQSPEVQNFGTINAKTGLGEVGILWNSAGGRTAVENIFAPSIFTKWEDFKETTLQYVSVGAGVGLIAGLPGLAVGLLVGGGAGLIAATRESLISFYSGSRFTVYEQTIWDVLQELTHRHPGTICNVVIFDRRSTIFFGYPEQLYFFRGPTLEEAQIMSGSDILESPLIFVERNLQDFMIAKTGRSNITKIFNKKDIGGSTTLSRGRRIQKNLIIPKDGGIEAIGFVTDDSEITKIDSPKGTDVGFNLMKQFRSYHMITSEHDIIENKLTVNSDGVFNSVQIAYPNSSKEGNFDGSIGYSEYKKTDEIKGDDDLNRDYIKRQTLVFHNAHTDLESANFPEKYAVAALCKSLNNIYKGRIKILGRPGLKPHDIVFVYDSYNSIYGAIEIKSVIHTFSYQTGWITEIIPQMIVTPTTSTSIPYIKALEELVQSFYLKNVRNFYSSNVFTTASLSDKLNSETSISRETTIGDASQEVFSGVLTGGAISTSAVLAQRSGIDAISKLGSVKNLNAIKGVGKLGLIAKGAKFGAGRLFGAGIPIFGDLMINYAIGFYTSWSKYRQPITFLPITRNGKSWYTGLHGLKNNTEIEAIKGFGKDILRKGEFVINDLQDRFPEVFE